MSKVTVNLNSNSAEALVLSERLGQVKREGQHPDNDVGRSEELARAAGCYIMFGDHKFAPADWPWDEGWWKPKDKLRNWVRAGALILAAIMALQKEEKR